MAAPGEQNNDAVIGRGAELFAKLGARERSLDDPRQGVANEACRNTMLAKKRFLKREDTEKAVDIPAHGAHSPLPPCPGLRSDQIDYRHTWAAKLLGQPQMKIGRIGEHRDVRPLLRNRTDQLAEFAV